MKPATRAISPARGGRVRRLTSAVRRHSDFTLLWSAMASAKLGSTCSAGANPLLALLLTDSEVFAGWVAAASLTPSLLMHLPAGWCVDHFNRRRLMFISLWGRLFLCIVLVTALLLVDEPKWWLVALTFCDGTLLVLYSAAEITAVRHVVNPAKLPSALALNESRNHLAQLAGRPLGSFLFTLNHVAPYGVTVLASVWSMIALRLMREKDYQPRDAVPEPSPGGPARTSKGAMRGAAREVARSAFLRTVIVVCAVGNFCFQIVVLLLVVIAREEQLSNAMIGLLLATSGVGGLLGSAAAPWVCRRIRDERVILLSCSGIWVVLTSVIAVSSHPVVGLVLWGLLSFTGGQLNVALMMHLTRAVPDHMLGSVMSINRFLTSGAVPLGALTAGYVVSGLGPGAAALLVSGMVTLAFVATPVLLWPHECSPPKLLAKTKVYLRGMRQPANPAPAMPHHVPAQEPAPVPASVP